MRLEMRPPAGSRLPVSSGSSSPDLQDRVRAYLDDAGSRLHDLGRRIEVLTLLVRGADAIPVDGGAVYLSGARPKLEEARVRAAQPFPLGTPVPSVLATVGQVLDRPPFGANPGQVRGLSFSAVTPLERQVVETGEGLAAEGEQLFGLIGKLLQVENGLRQAVVETLGEAADVRRRALGIPRPPVPKI